MDGKVLVTSSCATVGKGKATSLHLVFSRGETAGIKAYFLARGIHIYTISKPVALIDFAEKGIESVIRVSPHYYNTTEEIDVFLQAVDEWIR
jgi:selenocysteine lyase/cysteine desulfurase